jgi:hypothetical protein
MLLLKLLHLLCWVYWLGGDLGTFYASRFVADPSLSPAARATAAKIMMGADIAPRLCLPLTLVTGLHLASLSGALAISDILLWALWCVCAVWLRAVWVIHHGHGAARLKRIIQLDFGLRVLLSAGLGLVAGAGLLGMLDAVAPWHSTTRFWPRLRSPRAARPRRSWRPNNPSLDRRMHPVCADHLGLTAH